MTSSDNPDEAKRRRPTKVARLLDEYDLEGLGAELEAYWTADEGRRSLRDLATHFNKQLLGNRLEKTDAQPVGSEVETLYRLLTSDEVSSADRTRIRRRLERDGVDVESLESDFVTYQAIRTYLKKDRNTEYTPDKTDPIERESANLQQLQGRVISVTEGKLEQLRDTDELTLGEFRALATIQVVCEDCNSQFDLFELFEQGGCDCTVE